MNWINSKVDGSPYRLLSESEWEYAARAETTTPFWWGSGIMTDKANYNGNFTYNGSKGMFRQKTVPIDSFSPNKFGLYNVHGNVGEWLEDCWHKNYKGAPTDGSAWLEANSGDCRDRVTRGGAWNIIPWYLRSANRDKIRASDRGRGRGNFYGFRIARTL